MDFALITIDADASKAYFNTRKTDDNYNATLKKLKEYVSGNESISRISLITYSNSAGYYVFDTSSSTLGTKIAYDDYTTSIKAELINGRNSWEHKDNDVLYNYSPLRTIDDKLAGYVLVEANTNHMHFYYLILIGGLLVMVLMCFIFGKYMLSFIDREVFRPIKNFSRTALEFTGSVTDGSDINRLEMFKTNKNNEIGSLGNAIKKMIYDINNSTENLSNAIFEATHDVMTQLFNKRHYDNVITNFKKRSSICAIYFDVNNLKLMNDTLGHEHGDHVIKTAAEYVRSFTGDSCFGFRVGGDEFLLIMVDCSFREINDVIEKLDNDSPVILSLQEDSIKCALAYGYAYAKGTYTYEKVLAEAEENMYKKKNELKDTLHMPDR